MHFESHVVFFKIWLSMRFFNKWVRTSLFLIIFFTANSVFLLFAQTKELQKKEATAVRTNQNLEIDGKIDEAAWQQAEKITDFTNKDPVEGSEPNERIEVYILYDAHQLFIGARMYRRDCDAIRSFVSRRDNMGNSERIIISLDSYNNQMTAYSFALSATGVRADYYHASDSEGDRDYNYNPVWYGSSNIDSLGWTAEIAIPFSQLRFNNTGEIVFGLNINQYTPSSKEDSYWVMVPKSSIGWSSRFGKLRGISGIEQSSHIEIMPYMSSRLVIDRVNQDDHFFKKNAYTFGAGLDLKFGLSSNSTLDATINPDFGQVEADPARLNLTEFETHYEEKRPFFVEGNSLFEDTGINYYYSRRVGSPPRLPHNKYFVENINSTDILAAAKITSTTGDNLSLAAMSCVVNEKSARFIDTDNNSKFRKVVYPLSFYNIGRISKEFDEEGSNLGMILTSVNRGNNSLYTSDAYNKAAYSGGTDLNYYFADKKYKLQANFGFSHILASQKRIFELEQQTTQLFQRPDAKHLRLDSAATSLTGFIGQIAFYKSAGEHWLWNAGYYTESPGLNLNDFGILQHADEHRFSGLLKYRENSPSQLFYRYSFSLYSHYNTNYAGEKMSMPFEFYSSFTFHNYHSVEFSLSYYTKSWSDTKTRGGMMMALPPKIDWNIAYSTDYSKHYVLDMNIGSAASGYGDRQASGHISFEYKLMRWKFVSGINYTYSINPRQYLMTLDRNSAETYAKRYIFGKLRQNELSLSFKLNYSFTPDLTLEFYANPFVSQGKYLSFSELLGRNDLNMKTYGKFAGTSIYKDFGGDYLVKDKSEEFALPNSDFFYKAFTASAVLRWEYKPGCVFFGVWQIHNDDYVNHWQKITSQNAFDAATSPGINSFMLKLSYWLSAD